MDYTNEELKVTPTQLGKQRCRGKRTAPKADNLSLSSGSSVSGTTGKNHLGGSENPIRHQAACPQEQRLAPGKTASCRTKPYGEKAAQGADFTQLLLSTAQEESPASARGHLPAPGTRLCLPQPS